MTPASRAACPDRRRHYLRPARRSRHRELREVPAIDQAIRVSDTGCYPASEADLTDWAGLSSSGTETADMAAYRRDWITEHAAQRWLAGEPERTSPAPCRPSQGAAPCQTQMTV